LPTRRAILLPARRAALALWLLVAGGAAGQETIDAFEELDFDRPEAWGMKFAAAVTAFTAVEAPRSRDPGTFELGMEAASVPSLSTEERRIGFVGTKVEDIDRVEAIGRVRAAIGLGADFTLELGVIPPVELEGLTPTFAAAALARPLMERPRLRLGARLGYQHGTLEGDITCSAADVAAGDDPVGNPFGCEALSDDELETRLIGFELVAARASARPGGFEPYLAVAVHRLDGRFQVDARYNGVHDRTRLEAEGTFWSAMLGGAGELDPGWRLAGELFYAPLDIRRPDQDVTDEPVLNLRIQLSRRLR
jgi:hypothetical protein